MVVGWYRVRRAPVRLEVSDDAITQFDDRSKGPTALLRTEGGDLTFVARGSARYRYMVLMARGSETELPLRYFRRKKIEQACRAHGWNVEAGRGQRHRKR